MVYYYWGAFAVSLMLLLSLRSKMNPFENFVGSCICALFGFALWPLFLVAFARGKGGH